MTTIPESIAKAINENLPGLVGTELQVLLAEGAANKDRVAELAGINSDLHAQLGRERMRNVALNEDLAKHATLDAREQAITKREIYIDLTLAEAKAAAAEKSKGELFGLVGVLFKNPVVKESVMRSDSTYSPTGSTNTSSTATTTKEVE